MLDLNNHFLIAMPHVVDEDFLRSVLFVFDHGEGGAAALVINQPSESTFKDMFERIGLPLGRADLQGTPVYQGGPLFTERGFVLHEAQPVLALDAANDAGCHTNEIDGAVSFMPSNASFWASTLSVPGGLEMTTSRDLLEALSCGAGPQKIFLSLGYAAWNAGQLEQEIMRNDWLTVPAKHEIIFDTPPDKRYQAALALLGIDEVMLALDAGGLQ
jgi:putative transcriptional regulator